MKITRKFEYRNNEEYDHMGLAMVGRSWADPAMGLGVTHDILEHAPRDNGSTEGELMALGASIYVRSGHDYYERIGRFHTDPSDHISSDFPLLWNYMVRDGRETLTSPGKIKPLDDSNDDDSILETVRKAVELCRGEFDPDDFPTFLQESETEKIIGWMRKGYRYAQRRFKGIRRCRLTNMFIATERAVDRQLRELEEWGHGEGTLVTVTIDLINLTTKVTVKGRDW